MGDQLLDQAALAHPRFPEDGDEAAALPGGPVERLAKLRRLGVPPDQRRVGRAGLRHLGHARGPARPRDARGRPLLEDLLVELPRLGLRLHAQLAPQHAHAVLILAERGGALPELGVQAHERAVRRLLQRIEGEELAGRPDRGLEVLRLPLVREQPGQAVAGLLAQALARLAQPRLPRLLGDAHPGEQVAAVEGRGLRERLGRALIQEPGEGRHVQVDETGVDGHRVALGPQDAGATRQRPAQLVQGVAETGPRLVVGPVRPEQRGQAVAMRGGTRVEGQVSQQRLRLPGRQPERQARLEPGLEAAEEFEAHPSRCHHRPSVGDASTAPASVQGGPHEIFHVSSTVPSHASRYTGDSSTTGAKGGPAP